MTARGPSLETIKHTYAIVDEPAPPVRDWMADSNHFIDSKTMSKADGEEIVHYLEQCLEEIDRSLRWVGANRAYIGWLRDASLGVLGARWDSENG